MKATGRIIFKTTFWCPYDTIIRSKYNFQQITRILMFKYINVQVQRELNLNININILVICWILYFGLMMVSRGHRNVVLNTILLVSFVTKSITLSCLIKKLIARQISVPSTPQAPSNNWPGSNSARWVFPKPEGVACCSLAYLLNDLGRAVNNKQTLMSQLMSIVNITYYSLECWKRNIIVRCQEDVFDVIFKYPLNIFYFISVTHCIEESLHRQ